MCLIHEKLTNMELGEKYFNPAFSKWHEQLETI